MAVTANSTPLPSRRALLAVAAVPTMLGSYSGIRLAVAAEWDPDASLLALAATIPALADQSLTLGRARDRIEEACFDRAGLPPERPQCNPAAFPDFSDFDRAMDAWQAGMKARDAVLVAAGAALGLDDAALAYDAAEDALLDACSAIAGMRATTMAGLIAKARIAEAQEDPELRESIVADLLAMSP